MSDRYEWEEERCGFWRMEHGEYTASMYPCGPHGYYAWEVVCGDTRIASSDDQRHTPETAGRAKLEAQWAIEKHLEELEWGEDCPA